MEHASRVVVVGSGAAGAACVATLRSGGYHGQVTVVRAEDAMPYNRTAVNKAMLSSGLSHGALTLPEARTSDVNWLDRDEAVALDTARHELELASGARLPYAALVIATGSSPRPWPDSAGSPPLDRLVALHTYEDAARLRSMLGWSDTAHGKPSRVTILGAGLIGGETASLLSGSGMEVDLVGREAAPMSSRLGHAAAAWLLERHRAHVRPHMGRTIAGCDVREDGVVVQLDDGHRWTTDLLLVATGAQPNTDWLDGSGLDVSDGVAVDHSLRVLGADGLYAAGDVATVVAAPHTRRAKNWASALAQGQHAARSVLHDLDLGDPPGPFTELPIYTTRMYGTKLTLLGETGSAFDETLVSGNAPSPVTVFTDEHGRVRGAVAVGVPRLEDWLVEAAQTQLVLDQVRPVFAVGQTPT